MTNVKIVLDQARSLLGVRQYSSKHIQLVNDYNSVYPVPVGYLVNTAEDWCDVFITVIFDRANASHLIGRECGVERHIALFKGLGIWIEDGSITPQAGDIITWSWKDNTQPNNSWGDHIGIVESISNGQIQTIEGNSNSEVRRNTWALGHGNIRGFARPNYDGSIQPPNEPEETVDQYYTVVSGDSLWGISNQFGLTVDELCELNNITIHTVIHPGDRLIVREGKTVDQIEPPLADEESLIQTYSEYGTFTANQTLNIRSGYTTSDGVVATLYPSESVNYDSVYITTKFVWVSYISYSGIRRYVAIRNINNGEYGLLFGTIK